MENTENTEREIDEFMNFMQFEAAEALYERKDKIKRLYSLPFYQTPILSLS